MALPEVTAPPIRAEAVCWQCEGTRLKGDHIWSHCRYKTELEHPRAEVCEFCMCAVCHGTGTRTVTLTGIDALAMDYARKWLVWFDGGPPSLAVCGAVTDAEQAYRAAALTPGEKDGR